MADTAPVNNGMYLTPEIFRFWHYRDMPSRRDEVRN